MSRLIKITRALLWLFLLLLPIQTRIIYHAGFLNGPTEYLTWSLYAGDLLLGAIVVLTLIMMIRFQKAEIFVWNKVRQTRLYYLIGVAASIVVLFFASMFPANSFYHFTVLLQAVVLGVLLWYWHFDFRKVAWPLVICSAAQACLAIYQFFTQRVFASTWLGMSAQDPRVLGTPVVDLLGGRWLRTFGTLPHPNILAGFLLVGIILTLGLLLIEKEKRIRTLLYSALALNFLAIMTTLSRASFLALLAVVVFLSWRANKSGELKQLISRLCLAALALIVFFTIAFPGLMSSRAFSTNRLEVTSNSERLSQYQQFGKVWTNNFVLGTGLGNYILADYSERPGLDSYQYQPIHNVFLLIIGELGLLGLALVLCFGWYLVYFIKRIGERTDFELVVFSLVLALSVIALFDHYLWSFYFGLNLVAVVAYLQFRRVRMYG